MPTVCLISTSVCRAPCAAHGEGHCSLVKLSQSPNARRGWFYGLTTAEQRRHAARVGPLPAPVILEVHPYRRGQELPCNNDCGHCTRREDRYELGRQGVQGIDPERLLSLIESLRGRGVQRVVLSGNSTEPTQYPEIAEVVRTVKDVGLKLSLFSNYYGADRLLEVASLLAKDDVVRVSLDAGKPQTYNRVHRPLFANAFRQIMTNIENLVQQKRQHRREFCIEISYIITRANCAGEELVNLVNWGREHGVDRVRFSHMLCPRIGNDAFDHSQVLNEQETARVMTLLRELKAESADSSCEIQILDDEPEQAHKPFGKCHHWKLIAMLGACGKFFPCTSVSLVRLMRLGRGDVNSRDFNFWQWWAEPQKWSNLRPQTCAAGQPAECTRFEFIVNKEIDQLAAATSSRCPKERQCSTTTEF